MTPNLISSVGHDADWIEWRYEVVVERFTDALGRETNAVRCVWHNGSRDSAYAPLATRTGYPYGTDGYAVTTDPLGVETVRRGYTEVRGGKTCRVDETAAAGVTNRSVRFPGGDAVEERFWDGKWTRETRSTVYGADGCRAETAVTESSDYPVVTNSVTRYDFLGRAVATVTPLGVASNFYDGASMRILTATRTGQPPVCDLYNALGERVGTVVSGITNRTDVSYETVSGEVWRVASSLAGEVRSVTREQLTGLSDTLRRHTVAIGANNVTNEIAAVWDGSARTLTETQTSYIRATPSDRVEKYGRTISETSANGSRQYFFDPYGRVFYTERRPAGSSTWLSGTWLGFNDYGDVEEYDSFVGSGNAYTAAFHAHDAFARTLTATDALGHAVTNAYDALGRLVANSGATYPVDYAYDAQGRLTGLVTRYGASDAEAETGWAYDPATGLATNKMYADNSAVVYTHTPDGKPLRTTWARGAWREHAYDEAGLLATTTYSDATPAVSLAYDAFQRLTAASNAVVAYTYANDALGAATNESAAIGTSMHRLVRQYDGFHRLASLAVDDKPVHYGYEAESRLAAVSNDAFTVNYEYTDDAWDAGYTITLTNGMVFSRALTRETYRRQLTIAITNSVDGVQVNPLTYGYDLLNRVIGRNDDTFDYNTRSEVTGATITTNAYGYSYDGIGNNLWASFNSITNQYTANALNQYTNILCASAPPREDTLSYDADGSAPSEARRFLQGESPCRVRTSHPLVPSVGTVEEESHPNDIV